MIRLLNKIIGTPQNRIWKKYGRQVQRINNLEPEFERLTDSELRAKTDEFRNRLQDTEKEDDILPEAFAAVREASKRTLGQRHFDVQMMGGVVLHQGKIAEMRTGEGKTLVATLPAYLNALTGNGVHVVTVNDYLARRDPVWMGPIFHMLGLSVGCLQNDYSYLYDPTIQGKDPSYNHLRPVTRQEAYTTDIIYGTNNELGFDHLRDNLEKEPNQQTQINIDYDTLNAQAEQKIKYDALDAQVERKIRHDILDAQAKLRLNYDIQDEGRLEEERSKLLNKWREEERSKLLDEWRKIEQSKLLKDWQKPNFAIIDEVDNILIDEARTPLVISGPAQEPVHYYYTMAKLAPRLKPEEDYSMVDERSRAISLTEEGMSKIERWLKVGNLYDPDNFRLVHYVENALRAHVLYKRDKEYVVRDGEVIIVDEFTGRLQPGRRWSDGMHQAIEAKEGIKVQQKTITYATITLQNNFRSRYKKLAGMTGTAITEEEEFLKIYRLEVVPIPTNAPFIRKDLSDLIYQSESAKWKAVADDIQEMHKRERPVLVGTTSIENSEKLSQLLQFRGIPHQVLNAKQHERESYVVAQAGRPGAVTVATNMAGRGTDIVLGGNPESLDIIPEQWQKDHDAVVKQYGLIVIGTEHHEARRIDDQLRGRSGRQGDPGETRFYASMEDEIIKRFGGEKAKDMMGKVSGWAGLDKSSPLESRMITKILSGAQSRVEGYHFEARKHLQEFDDVLNQQRENIYSERYYLLNSPDLKTKIIRMLQEEVEGFLITATEGNVVEEWDLKGLCDNIRTIFPELPLKLDGEEQLSSLIHVIRGASRDTEEVRQVFRKYAYDELTSHAKEMYDLREGEMGSENMRILERGVMLDRLDFHWREHLTDIEDLRQGVNLQAYGQRNPLVTYRTEGYTMFKNLLDRMRRDVVRSIYRVSLVPVAKPMRAVSNGRSGAPPPRKMGRNAPCSCGSGKKYKRCHGAR